MHVTEAIMPRRGDYALMRLRTRDLPPPGPGEALVRVEATGVAFTDLMIARGLYPPGRRFPIVPGCDVVGVVAQAGSGVPAALIGQRVCALLTGGAWADHVMLPAAALAPVPRSLDPARAVAVVLNGLTAWQLVHRAANVRAGQAVLVAGASGGVGRLAVQFARLAGAEVVGTASPQNHARVRALGAEPLDYRDPALATRLRELAPRGFDVVLDQTGGPLTRVLYGTLRRGGVLVSSGGASDARQSFFGSIGRQLVRVASLKLRPDGRRVRFFGLRDRPGPARTAIHHDLSRIFALLQDGRIDPCLGPCHPLEEAGQALTSVSAGRAPGKVVLVPAH
jgi:NADPH:quinone reductase-like Zn-dependent oxidoreductase